MATGEPGAATLSRKKRRAPAPPPAVPVQHQSAPVEHELAPALVDSLEDDVSLTPVPSQPDYEPTPETDTVTPVISAPSDPAMTSQRDRTPSVASSDAKEARLAMIAAVQNEPLPGEDTVDLQANHSNSRPSGPALFVAPPPPDSPPPPLSPPGDDTTEVGNALHEDSVDGLSPVVADGFDSILQDVDRMRSVLDDSIKLADTCLSPNSYQLHEVCDFWWKQVFFDYLPDSDKSDLTQFVEQMDELTSNVEEIDPCEITPPDNDSFETPLSGDFTPNTPPPTSEDSDKGISQTNSLPQVEHPPLQENEPAISHSEALSNSPLGVGDSIHTLDILPTTTDETQVTLTNHSEDSYPVQENSSDANVFTGTDIPPEYQSNDDVLAKHDMTSVPDTTYNHHDSGDVREGEPDDVTELHIVPMNVKRRSSSRVRTDSESGPGSARHSYARTDSDSGTSSARHSYARTDSESEEPTPRFVYKPVIKRKVTLTSDEDEPVMSLRDRYRNTAPAVTKETTPQNTQQQQEKQFTVLGTPNVHLDDSFYSPPTSEIDQSAPAVQKSRGPQPWEIPSPRMTTFDPWAPDSTDDEVTSPGVRDNTEAPSLNHSSVKTAAAVTAKNAPPKKVTSGSFLWQSSYNRRPKIEIDDDSFDKFDKIEAPKPNITPAAASTQPASHVSIKPTPPLNSVPAPVKSTAKAPPAVKPKQTINRQDKQINAVDEELIVKNERKVLPVKSSDDRLDENSNREVHVVDGKTVASDPVVTTEPTVGKVSKPLKSALKKTSSNELELTRDRIQTNVQSRYRDPSHDPADARPGVLFDSRADNQSSEPNPGRRKIVPDPAEFLTDDLSPSGETELHDQPDGGSIEPPASFQDDAVVHSSASLAAPPAPVVSRDYKSRDYSLMAPRPWGAPRATTVRQAPTAFSATSDSKTRSGIDHLSADDSTAAAESNTTSDGRATDPGSSSSNEDLRREYDAMEQRMSEWQRQLERNEAIVSGVRHDSQTTPATEPPHAPPVNSTTRNFGLNKKLAQATAASGVSAPIVKPVVKHAFTVEGVSGSGRHKPQLDPREELMLAIRGASGRSSLKKVTVTQTKWKA